MMEAMITVALKILATFLKSVAFIHVTKTQNVAHAKSECLTRRDVDSMQNGMLDACLLNTPNFSLLQSIKAIAIMIEKHTLFVCLD